MAIARTIKNIPYILECDQDSDSPTTFHLKVLSALEVAELQDSFSKDSGHGATSYQYVMKSLTGWDNFLDEAGNVIKFNIKDRTANMNLLTPEYTAELAEQVLKINFPDVFGKLQGE